MADPIDQANELSERLRIEALAEQRQRARQRSQLSRGRPSSPDCLACGEPIPEERQALGGVTRCVGCETAAEGRGR
ncbi:TraR/DksA C4-type zinc finger protein [Inquilinus sp. CA228]|uniref:TraR/DksA C4-type zinc finger protein n=1 Tax=Inquilinus sp. CA228 TaxID=3455609 RepID=UPI003F8D116A